MGQKQRTVILRGLRGWKRAEGTLETENTFPAQARGSGPWGREGVREGGGKLGAMRWKCLQKKEEGLDGIFQARFSETRAHSFLPHRLPCQLYTRARGP